MVAVRKKWLLLTLLGIVLTAGFMFRYAVSSKQRIMRLRQDAQQYEAECLSLSNAVETARANVDWNRLQWYYAFREIEQADEDAWRMAVRKVDAEFAGLTNNLHRATDCLASRRAKLAEMTIDPTP